MWILANADARLCRQGCGIVEYEDTRSANRAIRELNNTALGGRPIFVREDREQPSSRQGRRGGGGGGGQANGGGGGGANVAGRQLYVGNLSFETTWADLKDHFRTAGEVERADVMMDSSRRSKGWGTVRFRTPVRNFMPMPFWLVCLVYFFCEGGEDALAADKVVLTDSGSGARRFSEN